MFFNNTFSFDGGVKRIWEKVLGKMGVGGLAIEEIIDKDCLCS